MTTIKLGGKLPKNDDRNGLHDSYQQFVRDPMRQHVVIAIVDTAKVINDIENYDTIPQLRIVAIEVVDGADAGTLRAIVQRRHEDRTGNLELPADWNAVLADITKPRVPGTEPRA